MISVSSSWAKPIPSDSHVAPTLFYSKLEPLYRQKEKKKVITVFNFPWYLMCFYRVYSIVALL